MESFVSLDIVNYDNITDMNNYVIPEDDHVKTKFFFIFNSTETNIKGDFYLKPSSTDIQADNLVIPPEFQAL
jgi:hypothetical protein